MKAETYTVEAYKFDTINDAIDFIQRNKRKEGVKNISLEAADDEESIVCFTYQVEEKLDSA